MSSKKAELILPLVSIRGIAALMVFWYHASLSYKSLNIEFFSIFKNGSVGVDLFFVLSGFILAYVYKKIQRDQFWSFYRHFMWARFARIYPLHLATLLFLLLIVVFLDGFAERYKDYYSTESFIINLLLMQNWGIIGMSWNMVSWSISAEWFMYLMFPIMLLWRQSRFAPSEPLPIALLAGLVIALHYTIIFSMGLGGYGGLSLGGMVRVVFEFTFGFLLYSLRPTLSTASQWQRSSLVTGALITIVIMSFFIKELYYVFMPAVGLLILNISIAQNLFTKILSQKHLVWLGDISYSLYMWHWILLQISNWLVANDHLPLENSTDAYIHFIIMTLITLFIAHWSYKFVEQSGRKKLLSLYKRPQ